jgi:antitoxin HicB
MARSIEEYLALPYTIEVLQDNNTENPGWVARVMELRGCLTQADSFAELEYMIRDAMRAWLETALADGLPIPEPRLDEQYSGKFVVRVPRSLHRKLVGIAVQEGVSLNHFINVSLAAAAAEYRNSSFLGKSLDSPDASIQSKELFMTHQVAESGEEYQATEHDAAADKKVIL